MHQIKKIIKNWILDFVKKNQGCSIGAIQKGLDLNYYAVHPIVKEMASEGLLELKPMANHYEVFVNEQKQTTNPA